MLFATSSLAARIERAECAMAVAFGELAKRRRADALVAPVGGAAAVYGGPAEPFNKLAGLGFAPLDESVLADVEREFDARDAPLQSNSRRWRITTSRRVSRTAATISSTSNTCSVSN